MSLCRVGSVGPCGPCGRFSAASGSLVLMEVGHQQGFPMGCLKFCWEEHGAMAAACQLLGSPSPAGQPACGELLSGSVSCCLVGAGDRAGERTGAQDHFMH